MSQPNTIAGKPLPRIGYGMISLMHPGRISTTNAIALLKAAFNAGARLWNASDYYGTPDYNSLHLLAAYFTAYPDDAAHVIVSVKSCIDVRTATTFNDAAGVRTCVERVLATLDGKCRVDIFAPGRLDPDVPVEETVSAIAEFVQAGKVGAIGLSECSGASMRRTVAAIAPLGLSIAAVEVEVSLFETGIYRTGVAEACGELGIPIVAYSPMSRGFLTGELRKYEDMKPEDYRKIFPRFAPENFDNNVRLVEIAEKVAKGKGCTVAQVAIAWVCAQGAKVGAPVIPIPGTASEERLKENTAEITLTAEELGEIDEALEKVEVMGERYPERFTRLLNV